MIEDPNTLRVSCDLCAVMQEMGTTAYIDGSPSLPSQETGVSFGVSDDTLTEYNWTRDGLRTFCPTCSVVT